MLTIKTKGKSVIMITGDVIYIRPQKRPYPIGQYLKHELSHCLLFQNTNLSAARKMRMQRWVVEGTAVAVGGPRYMSRSEFAERLHRADNLP